jgi:hypothetical protein
MSIKATWTKEALEATPWAVEFKQDAPVSYAMALRYAQQEGLEVLIEHTDEADDPQWAVRVLDAPSFWMDAKPTKKAAVELCRTMGWRVCS